MIALLLEHWGLASAPLLYLSLFFKTATRAIEVLAGIGILAETTGRKRDRRFAYRAYMERLRAGTEPDVRR
jgi:hypothetical protein